MLSTLALTTPGASQRLLRAYTGPMNDSSDDKQGERATPERVAPVEFKGMRYEAEDLSPGDASVNSGTNHVRAYDSATGTLVWDTELPQSSSDTGMEGDKQWSFIASLAIADGKLIATDERGETYGLDPKTGTLA